MVVAKFNATCLLKVSKYRERDHLMINHQVYALFFDKPTCQMDKTWDAFSLIIHPFLNICLVGHCNSLSYCGMAIPQYGLCNLLQLLNTLVSGPSGAPIFRVLHKQSQMNCPFFQGGVTTKDHQIWYQDLKQIADSFPDTATELLGCIHERPCDGATSLAVTLMPKPCFVWHIFHLWQLDSL